MTTPGGDIGQGEATAPQRPVATPRRGFDWVGLLAWCGAIALALALAGLPILVLRFSPLGHVLDDWGTRTTAEQVEPEVHVEPLPGRPPQGDEDQKPRAEGRIIGNPSWVVQPRPQFPDLAMSKGVETGRVELQCPVEVDGTIKSCWILSETPAGVGFGQAAVAAAAQARLHPRTVDGVPTRGMVRFATNFRMG